jgi:hypothetical protein
MGINTAISDVQSIANAGKPVTTISQSDILTSAINTNNVTPTSGNNLSLLQALQKVSGTNTSDALISATENAKNIAGETESMFDSNYAVSEALRGTQNSADISNNSDKKTSALAMLNELKAYNAANLQSVYTSQNSNVNNDFFSSPSSSNGLSMLKDLQRNTPINSADMLLQAFSK